MSKKLVIRINNLQDSEPNDTYEPTVETVIRWDRVAAVVVFTLLIICGASWTIWALLKNNDSTPAEEQPYAVAVETSMVERPIVDSQPLSSESAESDAGSEVTAPNTSQIAQSLPETEAVALEPKAKTDVVIDERIADKQKATVGNAVSIEAAIVQPTSKTPESVSPQSQNFSNPITIQSPSIARAQLTHNVKKKEPVDELGSIISMKGEGLIKVFLFTDMKGLKGETLYHSWYLGDKRMARVKINVRNNNLVASSSKFIDKYMAGEWTVKVANSRGDELVSADFKVVR